MEIMSHAYSNSHDRNSRAAEAYRLFSVVQDVATERERQRAALLDWENHLMFELAVGHGAARLPHLGSGEFGLWFRHKGAHAFQGAAETALILQAIDHIDAVLLPVFDLPARPGEDERVQRLRELREQARTIAFHLDALFQQNSELEAGRDVLTRLLNRKFLPVVLRKEVNYARQRGASFAILAIDIDHFKQVNDSYGHEAGDMVLQQVAVLLANSSRGGDYIFRLGGEEFLLLLVDVDQQRARKAAEKLRQPDCRRNFPPAAGAQPDGYHQRRPGAVQRPSRLQAHAAPRRRCAVPRQAWRTQLRGGGRRIARRRPALPADAEVAGSTSMPDRVF